jgi:hypothetical protein
MGRWARVARVARVRGPARRGGDGSGAFRENLMRQELCALPRAGARPDNFHEVRNYQMDTAESG